MKKKIFIILFLFSFLHHCEYKPIYSNMDSLNFKFNVVDIKGDNEMNNLVISNMNKYSNLNSNETFDLKINTNYIKEDLIKNKKGEVTTFLIKKEISFQVSNNEINKSFEFTEQLKTKNNSDKFEFKKYEKSIKNNFVNSKINELILKLSSLK